MPTRSRVASRSISQQSLHNFFLSQSAHEMFGQLGSMMHGMMMPNGMLMPNGMMMAPGMMMHPGMVMAPGMQHGMGPGMTIGSPAISDPRNDNNRTVSPPEPATRDASAAIFEGNVQVAAQPSFPDDDKKVSTSVKSLGLAWKEGVKRTSVKKFRCSLIAACDPVKFPMIRTSQLSEEEVDMLLFVVSGVLPNAKISDFGCILKRDVRTAVREQYVQKLRRNCSRLDSLSEEWDNLAMVAMRLGYDESLLSPDLKKEWVSRKRNFVQKQGHAMAAADAAAALSASSVKRPLALVDGSGNDDGGADGDEEELESPLPPCPQAKATRTLQVASVSLPPMKLPRRGAAKRIPALPAPALPAPASPAALTAGGEEDEEEEKETAEEAFAEEPIRRSN